MYNSTQQCVRKPLHVIVTVPHFHIFHRSRDVLSRSIGDRAWKGSMGGLPGSLKLVRSTPETRYTATWPCCNATRTKSQNIG